MRGIGTFAKFVTAGLLSMLLTACPNSTQQAQIAQAALTASTVASSAQQAEIAAYQQGKACNASGASGCIVISDTDHHFIEQQFGSLATMGKALDSCIRTSTTNAGAVACISTATSAIDEINSQGGLYIKSAAAKQDFQTAMAALKVALIAVSQVIGGK